MRFFRSEDVLRDWQVKTGESGEMLTLPTTWELSKRWYHNRLSASYRGRTVVEIEAIFQSMNFASDFWFTRASRERA